MASLQAGHVVKLSHNPLLIVETFIPAHIILMIDLYAALVSSTLHIFLNAQHVMQDYDDIYWVYQITARLLK